MYPENIVASVTVWKLKRLLLDKRTDGAEDRDLNAIIIACVDGLSLYGLPNAINTVYPQVRIHFIHRIIVRNSLRFIIFLGWKAATQTLKIIYQPLRKKKVYRCCQYSLIPG